MYCLFTTFLLSIIGFRLFPNFFSRLFTTLFPGCVFQPFSHYFRLFCSLESTFLLFISSFSHIFFLGFSPFFSPVYFLFFPQFFSILLPTSFLTIFQIPLFYFLLFSAYFLLLSSLFPAFLLDFRIFSTLCSVFHPFYPAIFLSISRLSPLYFRLFPIYFSRLSVKIQWTKIVVLF